MVLHMQRYMVVKTIRSSFLHSHRKTFHVHQVVSWFVSHSCWQIVYSEIDCVAIVYLRTKLIQMSLAQDRRWPWLQKDDPKLLSAEDLRRMWLNHYVETDTAVHVPNQTVLKHIHKLMHLTFSWTRLFRRKIWNSFIFPSFGRRNSRVRVFSESARSRSLYSIFFISPISCRSNLCPTRPVADQEASQENASRTSLSLSRHPSISSEFEECFVYDKGHRQYWTALGEYYWIKFCRQLESKVVAYQNIVRNAAHLQVADRIRLSFVDHHVNMSRVEIW